MNLKKLLTKEFLELQPYKQENIDFFKRYIEDEKDLEIVSEIIAKTQLNNDKYIKKLENENKQQLKKLNKITKWAKEKDKELSQQRAFVENYNYNAGQLKAIRELQENILKRRK